MAEKVIDSLAIKLSLKTGSFFKEIQRVRKELKSLEMSAKAFTRVSSGLKVMDSSFVNSTKMVRVFKKQMENLKAATSDTGKEFKKLESASKIFNSNFKTVGNANKVISSAKKDTKKDKGVIDSLESYTGLAMLGRGFKSALDKGLEFEKQMSQVRAVTNATDAQFKELTKSVFQLSNRSGISSIEIAEGMEKMARFGFDPQKILATMPQILDTVRASGEGFNTVLKVSEGLLSEFGLEAEDIVKVTDTLSGVAVKTRANISRMGEAFKYAAPVAKTLGVDMADLAAVTGLMINAGIEGGMAGRGLRMSMARLANPTKAGAAAFKELGIETQTSEGNMRSMLEILSEVGEKTKGMGNAAKAGIIKDIFGTEAMSGIMAVLEKGPDKVKELADELRNTGTITSDLSKKMGENTQVQINRLKEGFNNLQIKFIQTMLPTINKAVSFMNNLIEAIGRLDSKTKGTLVTIGKFTAGLLAMVAAGKAIKLILSPLKSVFDLFGKLGSAIGIGGAGLLGRLGAFGTALRFLGGPVGIAISSLSLLFPVISKLTDKYNEAKKELENPPKISPPKISEINEKTKIPPIKLFDFDIMSDEEIAKEQAKKSVTELKNEVKSLEKENDKSLNNVKKEWGKTSDFWSKKIDGLIRKDNEFTDNSITQSNRRIAQLKLEGNMGTIILETLKGVLATMWNQALNLFSLLGKIARGDWAGAISDLFGDLRTKFDPIPVKPLNPNPDIPRPVGPGANNSRGPGGTQGAYQISYNPTINVHTSNPDRAAQKTMNILDKNYRIYGGGGGSA